MHRRLQGTPLRTATTAGATVVILALALLLVTCGPTPTPQILVVTATFTPEPQVVVVTATDTPTPAVQVVTATFTPTPETVPSDTPSPTPTETPPPPTPTQPPSTDTPPPPTPTDTLLPPTPTNTSAPQATNTPKPEPSNTPAPKPTAKPASLQSYFVVYTAFKGPDLYNYSLWGMNGDGSDAFRVDGAGQASEPAFSPDGDKFAFYHWTDGLYIWNLSRQTSRRVVDNTEASFPTWAPDNLRLAYANLYGQPWIHIVDADGSNDRQLTLGLRPSWSQKGGFIAYDTCENNKCGIFRINPDGGGRRQLTQDSGGGAAVSPDGKRIAYWSQTDGDFEIYAINADGSGKVQLTQNQGNDALPAWSPDGKVIYYLSDQNGKGWAVMTMNADGSDKRKIITTAAGNDPRRGWQYQRITVTWNE